MTNQYSYPNVEARFWAKVDPCRTDGCKVWVAGESGGYGIFSLHGKPIRAHHFLVGVPPVGLMWDHVKERGCLNRNCICPEHLELVTSGENSRRGNVGKWQLAKTHCPQGHEYSVENTYLYRGKRNCIICGRRRAYLRYKVRQASLV